MYHIFFIHSSVDGHVLAIVNSAAVTLGCMYLEKIIVNVFYLLLCQCPLSPLECVLAVGFFKLA